MGSASNLKRMIYAFFIRSFQYIKRAGLWVRNRFNLPVFIILFTFLLGLYHWFSYEIPFTDNAFVVTNVTPVAADVEGFITDIFVKNGQKVKKDDPIFTVYRLPYELAYQQAKADYHEGLQKIIVFKKEIYKTVSLIRATESRLGKANYELKLKRKKSVDQAISKLEVVKLKYDVSTLSNELAALKEEVRVLKAKIEEQHHTVASLKAKMDNAKVNLDLTIVRSPGEGVVDNMYVSRYTPIKIHQPVFSFIDTSQYYIQANFNETDLRYVRPGDKAYIILRMYYFHKLFRGVVTNTLWAAERQQTNPRSQIQHVTNENEWLLLPQRFPIQIKILNPDPNYPLNPGASAYVYISPRR